MQSLQNLQMFMRTFSLRVKKKTKKIDLNSYSIGKIYHFKKGKCVLNMTVHKPFYVQSSVISFVESDFVILFDPYEISQSDRHM